MELGLASGKHIIADKALYSIGRCGAVGCLNLAAAGVNADDKGRIKVHRFYQSEVPNVYAAGDVVEFPSLAATSMEQGRVVVAHAFQNETPAGIEFFPYGIYTVPEVSFVGRNEEELTAAGIPYGSCLICPRPGFQAHVARLRNDGALPERLEKDANGTGSSH